MVNSGKHLEPSFIMENVLVSTGVILIAFKGQRQAQHDGVSYSLVMASVWNICHRNSEVRGICGELGKKEIERPDHSH